MKKGFVFYIHSVAGLVSGIFILLMSLSGAVLIFHDDIDLVQLPAVIEAGNKIASVDDYYSSVQKQYPDAQISNCILPSASDKPVSFFIYDSSYKNGTKALEVFLHPQTATVLNTRSAGAGFISWLSKFHNSFHLGKTGEWLLGFFALIFLVSIVTGIILFRKNILAVLIFRKSVYKRSNLHQLIAVYALLFNLMIAVTGFWMQRYVFKKEFYTSYDYTAVLKVSPALPFSFDSAYNEIKEQQPDFTARVIYFAQSNKGKTAVYGSRSRNAYIHSKKFADVIFLDSTGVVLKTRFINEIDVADRYDIINSQLHMGKFGGAGIKISYFVFGLTGALLSITGFLIWWRRTKGNRRKGVLSKS